jgi:triacylglycerol lipase
MATTPRHVLEPACCWPPGGPKCKAAPQVFCWRQPFFSQRWPDHLPADAQGRRGVLLVHGFVCNRGVWNPWLQRLHARDVPFVAVNLEPVFGSIDDYVGILEQAVRRLEAATGKPR